ncbi:small EDRK-rich factor 1-like [Sciurus carolinensis]|uniref:small EDRK-rich factor 1-like n=1 Tax=Sciurus carolinensis TaxID=30640 RepID=UPI001FB2B756|nr:small EDRK-rich factor 1-like [Sciurus carolinensis]
MVGMDRGNQRELAHQKNMKKTQEISKGKRKEDSLTTSQRKQRDSEIMQQMQKAANEKKSMQTREKQRMAFWKTCVLQPIGCIISSKTKIS